MATSEDGTREVATEETRANVGSHGFWRRGTTAIFDVHIANLNTVSYLHMILYKALAKAEKEKKYRYLQFFLDFRCHLTPLGFPADGILGNKTRAATQKMGSHLRFNLKREYCEMCGFMRTGKLLAVVLSNTILLRPTHYKEGKSVSNRSCRMGQ